MLKSYISAKPPYWWWMLVVILVLLLLLCGCNSTKVVTKTEYRDKIEYRNIVQQDTTYVHDSVFVRAKNDTIYIDKFKYVYTEHIKIDTAYVCKTDSVSYPVYVEKTLTKWQQLKMNIGGASIAIIILLILFALIYVLNKVARR